MVEGTTKRKPKKDVCHFVIALEVFLIKMVFSQRSKTIREEAK
jgi:hypothetical protein